MGVHVLAVSAVLQSELISHSKLIIVYNGGWGPRYWQFVRILRAELISHSHATNQIGKNQRQSMGGMAPLYNHTSYFLATFPFT